ncbi:MAG: hypothetical protein ACT4PX_07405 [Actinomycetota bacterium]
MPPPRRRPATPLAAVVALLALVAGGCSDGGGDATGATATTAASGAGEAGGAGRRGPANKVSVEMRDYAFDVSGSVVAGAVTLAVKNSGKELHMAAFTRLKAGKTLADVRAAAESEDEAAFGEVFEQDPDTPGTFLSPGQSEELTVSSVRAGTYAILCFLPTAGEGVPHLAKGMLNTLKVGEGEAEMEVEADATYAIDDGHIDGPSTLAPGRTTLRMTSAGTGPHELLVVRKKDVTSTFQQIDDAFDTLFESETPPPVGYADGLPAVIAAGSFDVPPGKAVFVTLDLAPGQYFIGCAREPDDDAAPGAAAHDEVMEVTVT